MARRTRALTHCAPGWKQNLNDVAIFRPEKLLTLRDSINKSAPIHSWSPLKSFRRIVASFYDIESATRIRQLLDGEEIMGERVRVYFGEPTPVEPVDRHLHAPASQKLFFISPPPSPPHGWEMRQEEPPNKQVHPEDLVQALASLRARPAQQQQQQQDLLSPVSPTDERNGSEDDERWAAAARNRERSASTTTMIYDPVFHGHSPDLPAIAVEDLTHTPDEVSPLDAPPHDSELKPRFIHTARPPVELMHGA
jgi:hypothetical protein